MFRIEPLTTIVVCKDDFAGLIVDYFDGREVKSASGRYGGYVFLLYVEWEGDFGIVSEIGYGYVAGWHFWLYLLIFLNLFIVEVEFDDCVICSFEYYVSGYLVYFGDADEVEVRHLVLHSLES